jgi:glycosyltransferase involved in cell wall biosynthesis
VPSYIASADACLCLYHDFPWSKYGFHLSSLKLFDYMASGKPVIASQLGQLATVIEDGKDGLLTKNDVNTIYQKILFCLENQEQAARIGLSARQKVIDFYNWERVAKSTLEVIESASKSKELAVGSSSK